MSENKIFSRSIVRVLTTVLIIFFIIWIIIVAYINIKNNELSNTIMSNIGFIIPVFKRERFQITVKTLPSNYPLNYADHEVKISTNEDGSFKIEGDVTWRPGNGGMVPDIWLSGMTHRLIGKNKIGSYIFNSHKKKPLVFEVYVRYLGDWVAADYIYRSGRGTVHAPNGKVSELPIYWYEN